MIDHEINLLPPAVIAARSATIYLVRAGRLLRFTIFLVCLVGGLLGGVYAVIWRTHTLVMADLGAQDERTTTLLHDVRKVNAQLGAFTVWRSGNRPWTPLVPEILAALPNGILLTDLRVAPDQTTVELRGTFTQRELLVAFQQKLEQLPWIEKVESPLSNFETRNETQFSLILSRKAAPP